MARLKLHGKAMKWNAQKQTWEPHKLINHKKSNEQLNIKSDINRNTELSREN